MKNHTMLSTFIRFGQGVFLALLAAAPASAGTAAIADVPMAPRYTAYDTQLFNLMVEGEHVVDGKVQFDPALAKGVETLLAQSNYVRSSRKKGAAEMLKKRLLSGPAPQPRAVALRAGGKEYVAYWACQAHACDETNLILLYQPDAKTAFAQLNVEQRGEYLGNPGAEEMALMSALKNAPAVKRR